MKQMKPIAIYFPQFHAIPENDKWWGEGFTDWTKVKEGYPLFEGHHQPRVPAGGYYDLTDKEVIAQQIAMAKQYGIYGFAIYHYWFDGKQLLETPKELILNNKELDIPFCLTWANETWARRWDGKDSEVLMEQTYEPTIEKWDEHFDYVKAYLKDPRAIKIDGKPVFQIYRPHLVTQVSDMIQHWRMRAREEGIGELYFMAVKSFDFPNDKILDDFDGVLLFQPHEAVNSKEYKGKRILLENLLRHCPESWVERMRVIRSKTQTKHIVHSYSKVFDIVLKRKFQYKEKDIFNMAFLEWDNTARYKEKATVYHGCTPEVFGTYFERLMRQESENHSQDKQFVFINAWNEWAEGTYLEPDTDNGYAYLEAVQRAVHSVNQR
jgi:lipopolysaccharide biosynthesis protein